MREVRLALLEADVNFGVVKEFVAHVRERALGEDVRKSLTPGQQVVKIVHEELTALLGSSDSRLAFSPRPPTTILLAGLQGSGKTTTAGKLALLLSNEGRKPALVAADLQRPAAIDQLVQLGEQVGVPVYAGERSDPVKAVHDGIEQAKAEDRDVVILDTAGRLHVDEDADGRARRRPARGEADERPAGARRDDRSGGRQRRAGVPGANRLRRRRPDEARRRRARRRRALRARGHRQADQARLARREARRARLVPPGPDGVADPRHGRRADADRARRGGDRATTRRKSSSAA